MQTLEGIDNPDIWQVYHRKDWDRITLAPLAEILTTEPVIWKMKLENELAEELGLERKIKGRMRKDGEIDVTKVGNRVAYNEEQEHKLRNLIQREMMVQELGDPQPAKTEQELVITQTQKSKTGSMR